MGVKLRLVQYPCRSGWPSGVRGSVPAFVLAAVAAFFLEVFVSAFLTPPDDCAPTNVGVNKIIANAIPKPARGRPELMYMWLPPRLASRSVIISDNRRLPQRLEIR